MVSMVQAGSEDPVGGGDSRRGLEALVSSVDELGSCALNDYQIHPKTVASRRANTRSRRGVSSRPPELEERLNRCSER